MRVCKLMWYLCGVRRGCEGGGKARAPASSTCLLAATGLRHRPPLLDQEDGGGAGAGSLGNRPREHNPLHPLASAGGHHHPLLAAQDDGGGAGRGSRVLCPPQPRGQHLGMDGQVHGAACARGHGAGGAQQRASRWGARACAVACVASWEVQGRQGWRSVAEAELGQWC